MAMTNERAGWLGGLKQVLTRVETTHVSRPEGENIVEIPHGLEKLRKAIVSVQNDLVEAQAERGDYSQAWIDCQAEITAALAKNASRQKDARHRLRRLQEEWVRVTMDLGIKAEIVPALVDDSQPD
jgi:hypothetical protein